MMTELTLIPRSRYSTARQRVRWSNAALPIAYTACRAIAWLPTTDETFTMEPVPLTSICLIADWLQKKALVTLRAMRSLNCSVVTSSVGTYSSSPGPPTLFTKASIRPCSAIAASMNRSQSSGRVTSAVTKVMV